MLYAWVARDGREGASITHMPCERDKPKPRIRSLLLHGSRLTAIVSEDDAHRDKAGEEDHGKLTVRVYDVSNVPHDGSPLTLLGEKDIRGNYDSARSVGATGFVVAKPGGGPRNANRDVPPGLDLCGKTTLR